MPSPIAVCSENCGLGTVVTRYIKVTVPLFFFPYLEYSQGIIYEYVRRETSRCVWERVPPLSTFWEIERLSRYENGWKFFEIEPDPGKWTWRFSLDRLTGPIVLNGWLKSFDRFGPLVPDPDKHCDSVADLDNYVPFHLFDQIQARIDPLTSLNEARHPKTTIDPCFCADECPFGTRPYRQYLITTSGTPFLPNFDLGKVFKIQAEFGSVCNYRPIEAPIAPASSTNSKTTVTPTTGDHAYNWSLVLLDGLGGSKSFGLTLEWNDSNQPNNALDALCSQTFTLLSGDSTFATVIPVPEWICDDQAGRDWVAEHVP